MIRASKPSNTSEDRKSKEGAMEDAYVLGASATILTHLKFCFKTKDTASPLKEITGFILKRTTTIPFTRGLSKQPAISAGLPSS